jgi:hypothetical protein
MMLPQEIEVWYVLPAIRREMCKELISQGFTQRKAAQVLGVTEAAVSQYVSSKRASKVKFGKPFLSEIAGVCSMIKDGKMTAYEGLQVMCRTFRQSGQICAVHRKFEKPENMSCSCKGKMGGICTK